MNALKLLVCGTTGLCFLNQNTHKTFSASCKTGDHRKQNVKVKKFDTLNPNLHLVVLPQFSRDKDGVWLTETGLKQIETIKTSIFDAIGSKLSNTRFILPELNGVKTVEVKDFKDTFDINLCKTSCFLGFNEPFLSWPITILGEPYYQQEQVENMEDSPTLFQQWARVEAAFRSLLLLHENESKVIIAPPASISYILCRVLKLPPESWALFSFAHGSITSLRVHKNGDVKVVGLGQTKSFVPDDEKACLTFQAAETVKLKTVEKEESSKTEEKLQVDKSLEEENSNTQASDELGGYY